MIIARRRGEGRMQRSLIVLGLVIALVGLAWPWVSKLPLGRLPGDILIDRPGFKLFFPLTTMVIISLVISLILMFFRK
jgi:Protein of unknown function (DUF2905).